MSDRLRLVFGVSGASGAPVARALLARACASDRVAEVHAVVSDAARRVARDELGTTAHSATELLDEWAPPGARRATLVVHAFRDIGARIASGSFRHDGMVVCPCSTATLAAIAHGTSSNLLHRAAECALKERLPLVLMVRETPLSLVHLENMVAVARAGATVLPICPPWYHRPATIDDLVDQTVDRALDHLGMSGLVGRRWEPS